MALDQDLNPGHQDFAIEGSDAERLPAIAALYLAPFPALQKTVSGRGAEEPGPHARAVDRAQIKPHAADPGAVAV